MISLSTSWNYRDHTSAAPLINEIRQAGFDTIELNFALTREVVDGIASLVTDGTVGVSSVHNICPLPDGIAQADASPDCFSLAATDEEERGRAVAAARATVECAARLGARAVVLHMGRVPVADGTRELARAMSDATRAKAVRDRIVRDRAAHRDDHLEQAMASLGELAPFARERGIALGIENRYYYREIPLKDEIGIILRNFRRSNVYYWHDVGHAEAFERLGLCSHRDLLDSFANRLLGIHLHDIIGVMNDHRAPGSGTFDFRTLEPYVTRDTIKVIEAHRPATAAELRKGLEYLSDIFADKT